jgi:hypothetical protein
MLSSTARASYRTVAQELHSLAPARSFGFGSISSPESWRQLGLYFETQTAAVARRRVVRMVAAYREQSRANPRPMI